MAQAGLVVEEPLHHKEKFVSTYVNSIKKLCEKHGYEMIDIKPSEVAAHRDQGKFFDMTVRNKDGLVVTLMEVENVEVPKTEHFKNHNTAIVGDMKASSIYYLGDGEVVGINATWYKKVL